MTRASTWRQRVAGLGLALWSCCGAMLPASSVRAEEAAESADVYARVVAETAPLRTGPGHRFRIARLAKRGDTFPVRARAAHGFWLEVALTDGSKAFVQGDMVVPEDATEAPAPSRIFAPPPLPDSRGEIAVLFGAFGESGLLSVRPNWLLAPVFALEANMAVSVGAAGRLFMGGLGGLFNLFPHWPITPFFTGGGGVAYALPNADSFVLGEGTRAMLYAGGGLRAHFRHHITLRIEARGYALFEEDALHAQQEISGGLSAFF